MIRSLRIRLLIATSLASAVVLALLGAAIYAAMWRTLMSDYDASLVAKAQALSANIEQRNGRVKLELEPNEMPEFSAREHPDYFQVWLDDGSVVGRSGSLQGADLPNTPSAARTISGSLSLPHTHRARAIVLTFTPSAEEESDEGGTSTHLRTCTVAVAGTPTQSLEMLSHLAWLLSGLCALAIVVSGAILLRVVSRAVSPVRSLAREIENVRESDLAIQLSPRDVPAELVPVVEKLNGLLHRLQKAFEREKAFTADVAHELRTPLAGLLATMEVCISRPREPAGYVNSIRSCCEMTERMQAMVENLLLMARADAGQITANRQPVDVASLAKELWPMFEARADARGLNIQWNLCEPCIADTDPDKLRIILQNLFDNAVSYADDSGTICIRSAIRNDSLEIEFANTGCCLSPDDMEHLFKRFWRGDSQRSETQIHCGLGLALSHRLIGLIGGTIAAAASNGEFVVTLKLPLASAPRREDAVPRADGNGKDLQPSAERSSLYSPPSPGAGETAAN
jgi:heavy metal sensor kinase